MQDILLRLGGALLLFSHIGSAYYIVTTTIELPPFSTDTLKAYYEHVGPAPYVVKSVAVSAEASTSKSAQVVSGLSTSTLTTHSVASPSSKVVHLSSSVRPCVTNSTVLANALSTAPCSSKISAVTTNSSSLPPFSKPSTSSQKYIITANANATAKLAPSAKVVTAHATNSTSPAACTAAAIALPAFPLSANTTSNLNALLQMILSVPESVFAKGDADVSTFFKGMGSCMSNSASGLKTDLTALVGPITSFVASFSTSVLTGLESAGQDIGNELGHLFGKRDAFADLLANIENVAACMSNVANNSTLFDVAKCAVDLAELTQPASRFTKIKNLIGTAGGVARVLTDLENGASAETVGKDSLNVLEEALGIADAVKTCGFVVEKVKAAL